MKHQYESEILFHLMERDGFNIPSSVPPYESEIKAYLINQVKLAYPKLTDYEAEWLLYNYTKHLPADFPISSATNVTKATFENVVPFAYQSAILKGQTLVNIFARATKGFHYNATNDGNKSFTMTGDGTDVCQSWWNLELSTTKQYILSFDVTVNTADRVMVIKDGNEQGIKSYPIGTKGKQTVIFTPTTPNIRFKVEQNVKGTIIVDNIMVMEYQAGMENWDIAYFEGMQSVKRPVLTITGKNLFDKTTVEKGVTLSGSTGAATLNDKRFTSGFIFVKNMKDITISISSSITARNVWGYDANKIATNKILASGFSNKQTITIPNNIYYIRIPFGHVDDVIITDDIISSVNIQIEESSTETLYEPYKSNILTVNEEVELRGIGDVKDTLDCLTGELTQRIKEFTLTKDETKLKLTPGTTPLVELPLTDIKANGRITSNKISETTDKMYLSNTVLGIDIVDQVIRIRTKEIAEGQSLDDFKNTVLPLKIQYQLKTESVKTVDLKTINESGESVHFMPLEGTMHVQSSGETIQPTFDMSVPVEATTQNLASFIDLEMRE